MTIDKEVIPAVQRLLFVLIQCFSMQTTFLAFVLRIWSDSHLVHAADRLASQPQWFDVTYCFRLGLDNMFQPGPFIVRVKRYEPTTNTVDHHTRGRNTFTPEVFF
jgi:hypothetical protein